MKQTINNTPLEKFHKVKVTMLNVAKIVRPLYMQKPQEHLEYDDSGEVLRYMSAGFFHDYPMCVQTYGNTISVYVHLPLDAATEWLDTIKVYFQSKYYGSDIFVDIRQEGSTTYVDFYSRELKMFD